MADRDITQLLKEVQEGSASAREDLFKRMYDELRRLAAHYMRNERQNHTLQPTALVHEAYVRLLDQRDQSYENRAHFFGVASNVMRRVLIDHARAHRADKRGGNEIRVPLDDELGIAAENIDYVLDLDRALDKLHALDARQAKVVELRFFGGLSVEQAAEVLGIVPRTVDRDWKVARAWLKRELAGDP